MNRILVIGAAALLMASTFPGLADTQSGSDASAASTDAPTHPALRDELLDLYARDQEARKALLSLLPDDPPANGDLELEDPGMEEMRIVLNVKAIDAESSAFMKEVVSAHGFPSFTMVGEDGANAAWMLVQHADAHTEFQQRARELMEPLVEAGEADPSNFAHLTDRVLLARGERQRFATQFDKDDDGVLRPRPTESPETLDERREAFGLLPLARHVELLSQQLGMDASPVPLEPR